MYCTQYCKFTNVSMLKFKAILVNGIKLLILIPVKLMSRIKFLFNMAKLYPAHAYKYAPVWTPIVYKYS